MQQAIKRVLWWAIRGYQKYVSPMLGPVCRFYPSCSHYAYEALHKYSLWKALWKITARLLRCGPWHSGGIDHP